MATPTRLQADLGRFAPNPAYTTQPLDDVRSTSQGVNFALQQVLQGLDRRRERGYRDEYTEAMSRAAQPDPKTIEATVQADPSWTTSLEGEGLQQWADQEEGGAAADAPEYGATMKQFNPAQRSYGQRLADQAKTLNPKNPYATRLQDSLAAHTITTETAATTRAQKVSDMLLKRRWGVSDKDIEHTRKLEIERAKLGEGPYQGKALNAQHLNFLLKGDPSSKEYHAAWSAYSAPKSILDPSTGAMTTVTPDMRPFRPPVGYPGAASAAPGGAGAVPGAGTTGSPPPGSPRAPQRPPGHPNIRTTGLKLTPAEKKVDVTFADDYSTFVVAGGYADVEKNLTQLDEVVSALEGGSDDTTGPIVGNIPTWMRSTVNPLSADIQEAVEEVVQRNLRIVLGAAFTQKEGDRLIARAYNPRLEEKVNAKRVKRLVRAIKEAARAKKRAGEYYEMHGTLKGYKGTHAIKISDIEAQVFGKSGKGRVLSTEDAN